MVNPTLHDDTFDVIHSVIHATLRRKDERSVAFRKLLEEDFQIDLSDLEKSQETISNFITLMNMQRF